MEKATIFEELFNRGICFSVNVSLNTFKLKSISDNSRDYFFSCLISDLEELKQFGFKENKEFRTICNRDLTTDEIIEFKSYSYLFIKVIHNKHGRVYELKNDSFKLRHDESKSKSIADLL